MSNPHQRLPLPGNEKRLCFLTVIRPHNATDANEPLVARAWVDKS